MKKPEYVVDKEQIEKLEQRHKEVRASMNPSVLKIAEESDRIFEQHANEVFDFDSEKRVRDAGYTPQQAEDIATIVKTKHVGQLFSYGGDQLVLTPFKTVVKAQVYLTLIQDRFLELTSVPTEVEISNLKNKINGFTSLTFFGLIKLAFKRLLNNGVK